jgi:GTP-binding protein
MSINKAVFVKSSVSVSDCPPEKHPEYAFIGRSNVGKSSLINTLTNQKELAKTSATPGKTQMINHFLIDNKWNLIDLPGYGFAKAGKGELYEFNEMILQYIEKRGTLRHIFVLVDIRHAPQANDIEFMAWLMRHEVSFSLIFTKADKLSKAQIQKSVQQYQKIVLNHIVEMPNYFITSAIQKMGKEMIVEFIEKMNRG